MKVCSKCKTEKDFDEFHKDKSKKDGRQSYCKKCLTDAAKFDYKKNNRKDLFVSRANDKKKQVRELFNKIRSYNGCAFCDEQEICCMDFHHLDPSQKDVNVSYLCECKSKDRMLREMKKCVVVCSNCHRKIHAGLLTPTLDQLCKIEDEGSF